MPFEELIGASFGLIYTDINPDENDNVDMEIDQDPDSPTFNHIKPVNSSYVGYTQQGVDIDFGAQYGFIKDGKSAVNTQAFLESADPSVKTQAVFNRDPNVMKLTRLPGQDLRYRFWFGSNRAVQERNFLIAEYNRIRRTDGSAIDVVLIWLIFRGFFQATQYKIIPTHESIEVIFTILRAYQFGSATCFRNENDLGSAWYVDKYDPSILVYPDGTPVTSVTPQQTIIVQPNGIMLL